MKDFELLEQEIRRFHIGNRTESSAMLAWFLETVWRMEPESVADSICDGGGDKGIDAIEVDIDLREVTVFQAKRRSTESATQGDKDLKQFVGSAAYFVDLEGIDSLLDSKPNQELRNLIERLDLRSVVEDGRYTFKFVFITNAQLDFSGEGYVDTLQGRSQSLAVWDRDKLVAVAKRTRSLAVQQSTVDVKIASDLIVEDLGKSTRLAIALITATELVRMPGIEDRSIFELNVRLGLGKTRINKELAATIGQSAEHELFPAYHNGLTILTRGVVANDRELTLDGVSVVNGCQSLLSLYTNRKSLTPDLRVLVKFVELGDSLDLVDSITYRTNNQNAVNARDLRSTDPTQRDLQTQVSDHYGSELAYVIRNGEKFTEVDTLENSVAAQLLMAVYVGEPWNAVRKVKLFDQEYHRVFGREADGHRLYLLYLMNKVVTDKKTSLLPELQSSFASVRFTFLHLLATVVRMTDQGEKLLDNPHPWFPSQKDSVVDELSNLADDVVSDLNFYIQDRQEQAVTGASLFDPKTVFKSRAGVRQLEQDVKKQAMRTLRKDPEYGFSLEPSGT